MRVTLDVLQRFTDLPTDPAQARILLDEVGVEVKRIDAAAPGVPMTLELLANRGDHHGYVGLAREVSGRTGGAVRTPEGLALTVGEAPHEVIVETELCPVYALTRLVRRSDAGLDADALALLDASGLKSVGPVVDATNVANLELGQPTHAFDAATIVGPIRVRLSKAGEQAWPLFAEAKVTVPEGSVVIADDEKILAIAGVIGCEESKTTPSTTEVLLEAASFDPVAVRKASRALGIHTDSSARFERGSDFTLPVAGAGRVAKLLSAGWDVQGTTGVWSSWTDPARDIVFDPAFCRAFLDITEDDATLLARLARYGFHATSREAGKVSLRVPAHRLWDVEYPADLYEEIAKSIGYDNTPVGLPPVDMGALPSAIEVAQDRIAEVLVSAGFYEVITDGFYGRTLFDQLGVGDDHVLAHHVETANALDRAYSLLKNNAIAQAIDGVAMNVRMKHHQIKAFEFTRTFHPDASAANGVCTERRLVWGIVSGSERPDGWAGKSRTADALFLKGLVAEIGRSLGLPLTVGAADANHALADVLHPGRQAAVRLDGEVVGVLGEVHPGVVQRFKLKRVRPCYLELDLAPLVADARRPAFEEPGRVPPAVRNLAFTLPSKVQAGDVAQALRRAGPDWLIDVSIVDLFEHDEDGAAVRTFTYALSYDNEAADRTADEMNATTEALIAAVSSEFGDRGVRLRGA